MKKYDITDKNDCIIDLPRHEWLCSTLQKTQYEIVNQGFLIDSYYVTFIDSHAELMYLLRWT